MPMKVMVTGGSGFLGRAVIARLHAGGHKAWAPRSAEYDLRTHEGIHRALGWGPDTVIHCAAAVGGIGANEAHPGRFLFENAIMGLQLMEQARRAGVQKFTTIGTACEYPQDAPVPLGEATIWDGYPAEPTAAYGVAKRLLLAQGQAYRAEYGFNVIHLIPTNLYGPGDNFDPDTSHVIPALVARFSEAVRQGLPSVRCWGTGRASREFLYVADAAEAIVAAAALYDSPEPVNIGTGEETTIRAVADYIARSYGFTGEIRWDGSQPDGVSRRWMDVSRAEEAFGFRAQVSLDDGLDRTIAWYESEVQT